MKAKKEYIPSLHLNIIRFVDDRMPIAITDEAMEDISIWRGILNDNDIDHLYIGFSGWFSLTEYVEHMDKHNMWNGGERAMRYITIQGETKLSFY
jgi:hypothetical protein